MSPQSRYRKVESFCQPFETETVMLEPRTGNFFVLDDISKFVWDRLEETTTLEQISEEIVRAYEVDHATALQDLVLFVQELLESELVTVVG